MANGHPDLMFNSNNWHHDRHVKYIISGYIWDKNILWINRDSLDTMFYK